MKNRWIVGVLLAAVLGTATAVALVAPASAVRPGEAVGLLESAPDANDPVLPYVETFRLDAETVRFAGQTASQRFWVAVDIDGKVCIITAAGNPETAGGACAPAGVVKSSGVMVGLTPDPNSGVPEYIVYLLPDAVTVGAASGPWHVIGSNVVVADAEAARSAEVVSLARSDGGQLALTP